VIQRTEREREKTYQESRVPTSFSGEGGQISSVGETPMVSGGDEDIDDVQQGTAELGVRSGCSIASWDGVECG
jgi:hypothetical protein